MRSPGRWVLLQFPQARQTPKSYFAEYDADGRPVFTTDIKLARRYEELPVARLCAFPGVTPYAPTPRDFRPLPG